MVIKMCNNDKNLNKLISLNLLKISNADIEKLKGYWITTVEEFISACAVPEGRSGIIKLLELDSDKLDEIFEKAVALLPPGAAENLSVIPEQHPLGVVLNTDNNEDNENSDKDKKEK